MGPTKPRTCAQQRPPAPLTAGAATAHALHARQAWTGWMDSPWATTWRPRKPRLSDPRALCQDLSKPHIFGLQGQAWSVSHSHFITHSSNLLRTKAGSPIRARYAPNTRAHGLHLRQLLCNAWPRFATSHEARAEHQATSCTSASARRACTASRSARRWRRSAHRRRRAVTRVTMRDCSARGGSGNRMLFNLVPL